MSNEGSFTEKLPEGEGASAKGRVSQSCPLATGTQLGRYRILRPLGAGGMGEVYVAEDARLGRQVAVKVIRSSEDVTPRARARFEQEARAASALTHPNIVTIFDIGDAEEQPFIVMELLDGRSLRELSREPMALPELIRIAVQIADALSATHERGIVHRDLKPENVFVTKDGIAKILDFGIARIRHADFDDSSLTAARLTAKGSALGTIGYMAPEVIAGEPADFRADIFSLGCILYEMAAGRRTFTGQSLAEVLAANLREDPPALTSARPDLPAAFCRVVEKALRKNRDERHASTTGLRDELAAIDPASRSSAPSERPAWLPSADYPLLGRESELEAIRRMIVDERSRLVTLTGPGGSGKTRLALTAAEQLLPWFAGRVFFVPLAAVTDRDLVGSAIAQALGAGDPSRAPLPSAIAALRSSESRALIVIDNFEQVIDAASDVAELIAACAAVTIIVTSREILHLYAERTLAVPPLVVPDRDDETRTDDVLKNPAVMLFIQRARAVNPALELDPASVAAIAEICRHLDGLPLAIELAAARTRLITPRAMLTRIGERLKLLTGGARDLPGRQQTLRRTLDWSYELLSPGEQALLRRVSVFTGSFTFEQAEAVADPFGRLDLDVVDGVGSLVDKSLLVRRGDGADEPRFAMLGVVRDYAAEQLASSGEDEATRKAHAAYYVVLAEEGSGDHGSTLESLAREHDNLRAALEWTTASGQIDWGLRMAVGIFPFWERSEHLTEGRRRLEALLAKSDATVDRLLKARALFSAAVLACTQKDYEVAIERADNSLALFRAADDSGGMAVACNALGVALTEVRQLDRAATVLETAIALWSASNDATSGARSLTNLAMVRRLQGDCEAARRMYRETEAVFQKVNDSSSAAWARNHQGDVARDLGELDAAAGYYESALAAFRRTGDAWGIASSLVDLGHVARRGGRLDDAGAAYREALGHFARLHHSRGIARVLEAMAITAVEEELHERALTLAGAASRLREILGAPTPEPEQGELRRAIERARAALDLAGSRQPYQCGRCMGVTEAVDYALSPV